MKYVFRMGSMHNIVPATVKPYTEIFLNKQVF